MTERGAIDARSIQTIRFLAVDAVEAAESGHPGAPLGAAPVAYALWDRVLKHDPADPQWPDRDRFVLSAGHASALLYALLHLTGYALTIDDLRRFRQWHSKTPGHPEYGDTPGVEATTGPLGQGMSHAVGMAIAEWRQAATYNRPGHDVVDHHTFALVSDGDLQEGVSSEAASLAGTLGLGKLVCLYDDNDIQIEGDTDMVFTEDVGARFEAYGWQVLGPLDGNDVDAVERAIRNAMADGSRPSLVICHTTIGFGSPLAGTAKVHGSPLGADNTRETKEALGWAVQPPFLVPDDVRAHMRDAVARGAAAHADWSDRVARYADAHPEEAKRLHAEWDGDWPDGWDRALDNLFSPDDDPVATRAASGLALNALSSAGVPLMGGSADLGPSNKTWQDGLERFSAEHPSGRNMRFGVREHAMGAILGGMALHGGAVPYGGTFLVFSDYMRPPMRLAALMGLHVVYVFTHDSIGLGEDGPTHQPVEQLMGLRSVPNLTVLRPADARETAEAWRAAVSRTAGPTAIVLTRQKVPHLDEASAAGVQRGAYVLWASEAGAPPDLILIATGSEVHLALAAGRTLAGQGVSVRVVSMPSWELFDAQDTAYRDAVLPPSVRARVAVEAGAAIGWERYVGLDGEVIGMTSFGASAPGPELMERFGFTSDAIVSAAQRLMERLRAVDPEGTSP